MSNISKKVIVGLSGGVDSSVAAFLLKQQGYTVEGLFMKNWEDDDQEGQCSFNYDIADAKHVCDKLDIPFHTVNFAQEYWEKVFSYFLTEYKAGRTPNPDILCNKEIKFKAFLDYALSLGADYIATGHYARINRSQECYQLLQGLDKTKDQSYFLYTLQQQQLAQSLFPVGEYHKTEVRKIAKQIGFLNHNKKDSTGICFIGERKFNSFLSQYLTQKPGEIVTEEGKVIGHHQGLMFHTIGQRKGLQIGGLQGMSESPWYVAAKELSSNRLVVVQGDQHPLLFAHQLICEKVHWIGKTTLNSEDKTLRLEAKIRYRQPQQSCHLKVMPNQQYHVIFDNPQRAITPGQSIVFYHNDECLGGGIIISTLQDDGL